jgi:hypothetical protein
MRKLSTLTVLAAGLALLAGPDLHGQTIPKAGLPVLTTSAGQSSDVETLNIVME